MDVFQSIPATIDAMGAGEAVRIVGGILVVLGLWRYFGKNNKKLGLAFVVIGAVFVLYSQALPVVGTIIGTVINAGLKFFKFLAERM